MLVGGGFRSASDTTHVRICAYFSSVILLATTAIVSTSSTNERGNSFRYPSFPTPSIDMHRFVQLNHMAEVHNNGANLNQGDGINLPASLRRDAYNDGMGRWRGLVLATTNAPKVLTLIPSIRDMIIHFFEGILESGEKEKSTIKLKKDLRLKPKFQKRAIDPQRVAERRRRIMARFERRRDQFYAEEAVRRQTNQMEQQEAKKRRKLLWELELSKLAGDKRWLEHKSHPSFHERKKNIAMFYDRLKQVLINKMKKTIPSVDGLEHDAASSDISSAIEEDMSEHDLDDAGGPTGKDNQMDATKTRNAAGLANEREIGEMESPPEKQKNSEDSNIIADASTEPPKRRKTTVDPKPQDSSSNRPVKNSESGDGIQPVAATKETPSVMGDAEQTDKSSTKITNSNGISPGVDDELISYIAEQARNRLYYIKWKSVKYAKAKKKRLERAVIKWRSKLKAAKASDEEIKKKVSDIKLQYNRDKRIDRLKEAIKRRYQAKTAIDSLWKQMDTRGVSKNTIKKALGGQRDRVEENYTKIMKKYPNNVIRKFESEWLSRFSKH